ncbi:MAG TPA: anti-sigma factor [Gemmatimonadota bacterium]|nr:anti-sigma factor [Gemmatimonadota bacterium]
MPRLTTEEFEERAILYALGALNPAERARFEAEREALGEAGERTVAGARRAVARAGMGPGATPGPAEREALAAVTDRPLAREGLVGAGWLGLALVLVAALCVAAFVWGYRERSRAIALEVARGSETARADSLARVVTARDSAAAARMEIEDLLPILAAPDAVALPLEGQGEARGRLLAGAGRALVVARGLLPVSQGLRYQLWHEGPAGLAPIAALGRAEDGSIFRFLAETGFLEGWGALLVTVEPERGSTRPTGATVLEYRGRLR